MQAPTVMDLLSSLAVQESLEVAWNDLLPNEPVRRHEEGGWIYMDVTSGGLMVRRAPAGTQTVLNLNTPPIIANAVVVATFHTHPNPNAEGWEPGPSAADTGSALLFGVPCIIRADDGDHTTGPTSRRGGLRGGPGYPP
jgi:hypothetical protein